MTVGTRNCRVCDYGYILVTVESALSSIPVWSDRVTIVRMSGYFEVVSDHHRHRRIRGISKS